MITMLIVEDEPAIARAIKKLIHSLTSDFMVQGIANNGKEALEQVKILHPDVIITDIRMPVMDGIEFMTILREMGEEEKLIVLSGCEEFDYVKQAMKARAMDYLLKPVIPDELIELLDKIRVELKEKKQRWLLRELYTSDISEEGIKPGDKYLAAIFFGSVPMIEDRSMLPGAYCWNSLNYAEELERILKDITSDDTVMCNFVRKTAVERVIILEKISNEDVEMFWHRVFEDLKKRLQLPFSVVYNQSGVDIGSIGQMHAVLCKFALKETHFGAQNLICFKNDDTDELQLAEDGEELLYLRRAMQKGDIAQIKDILSRFLEKCKQENCKTEILYQYLESIRMYIMDSILKTNIRESDIRMILSNSYTYEMIFSEFEDILNQEEKEKNDDSTLGHIKKYIENHYKEPLTNNELANRFGLAPSYLCKIYKKKYGISISRYLTQLKIEAAKKRMAEEPECLIKEIALDIGYKDQYYFSKVFKKETGKWPTEFFEE